MYWFTSDEHYFHENILKFCSRPFKNLEEMQHELIKRHNEVVKDDDITIHAGDFLWKHNKVTADRIIQQLNGRHIFLRGSHDKWLKDDPSINDIWQQKLDDIYVVVCHYQMFNWPRSHYGSWQLFGHSHFHNKYIGKQHNICVDMNNFYPVSLVQIKEIMKTRNDNSNLIKKRNIGAVS